MDPEKDQSASSAEEKEIDVTSSAATSTAEDSNAPDLSPAKADDDESMADAILAAVGPSEEDEAESSEDDEPKDESDAAKPEGDAKDAEKSDAETEGEEKEDNGEDVAEGQKIPYTRFKNVIDQRNKLKEKIQTIEQETETYKQGHTQFKAITDYMQQHELSHGDVAEALQIAGLMNRDPAAAMQLLMPKVQMLQQYTGEILPADLQEQVDTGEISQKAAQEIVRNRNEIARINLQNQKRQQVESQQSQQQRVQQVRQAMGTAANAAQERLAKADPDFAKKAPLLRDRVSVLIQQLKPQTAEDADKLVVRAHQEVTEYLRGAVGKPEIKPGPSSKDTGGNSISSEREPATMAEAIARAVN